MHSNIQYPSFLTRFLCGIYDSLLLLGVWFLVGSILLFLNNFNPLNPFVGFIVSIITAWSFFAFFWMRGGQTLGMKVWKIKLVNIGEQRISLSQTALRFLLNVCIYLLAGLPLLLIYLHPQRLAINDILSKTKLIKV